MYLDFYNLSERPFTLSPDPKFTFYSNSHKEAMSQFVFSLSDQIGFIVVTGEVGTGKTTLINTFISNLPKSCVVASINHQVLTTKGLIQNICKQFKLEYSRETTAELLLKLKYYLYKMHEAGKQTILILDEAQTLSLRLLEDIRILSNIEAFNKKYFNIFMLGQPELNEKLKSYVLRPLRDRIINRYHLKPMSFEETTCYLNYRLKVAGYDGPDLMTEKAVSEIYDFSKGVPRKINVIADKALLMGYVTAKHRIDADIVTQVIEDNSFDKIAEYANNNIGNRQNRALKDSKNGKSEEVPEKNFSEPLNYLIKSEKKYSTDEKNPDGKGNGLKEDLRCLIEKISSLETEIRRAKESKPVLLTPSRIILGVVSLFVTVLIAVVVALVFYNYL